VPQAFNSDMTAAAAAPAPAAQVSKTLSKDTADLFGERQLSAMCTWFQQFTDTAGAVQVQQYVCSICVKWWFGTGDNQEQCWRRVDAASDAQQPVKLPYRINT
jgi:hypothetical protein